MILKTHLQSQWSAAMREVKYVDMEGR